MAVKRYDGSQWVTVAGKGDQGTSSSIATWVKTASGGETSVSGNDDNSQPLSYTVGQELVFINGALQKRGSDYTATTGNSITGLTALATNDVVTVWTVNAFSVTNAISNTLVNAKGDLVTASGADVPAILTAPSTNNYILTSASGEATGLKWAAPETFVGCYAGKTATQSIANTTYTAITFDTESYDTDSIHNNSTNNSRFTVPTGKGGKWLVTATAAFASNATGYRVLRLYNNGTGLVSIATQVAVNGDNTSICGSFVYNFTAGDYLEAFVYQNSGGNLNLQFADTTLQFTYLGA